MNLKDLRHLDKEELLGLLGLETRRSDTGAIVTALGVGLLVGAGLALLLAPKPGRELREDIRDRLRRTPADPDERMGGPSERERPAGASKSY